MEHDEKRSLYKEILLALNEGGLFLNREIVLGSTPKLTETYERIWREFMQANGEDADAMLAKYLEEDRPAKLALKFGG
ncbi:MAG: hypothetical protein ACYC1U_05375 [Candidatus Aquicultorales bacterium]